MLEIKVYNVPTLVLSLIGLSGELDYDFYKQLGITQKYASECISQLIEEKKIIKGTSNQGTYLRLKKPEGIKAIYNLSPKLCERYLQITDNHKFATHQDKIIRRKKTSELTVSLYTLGIPIDNIVIKYESVKGRRGAARLNEDNLNNTISNKQPGVLSSQTAKENPAEDITYENEVIEKPGVEGSQQGHLVIPQETLDIKNKLSLTDHLTSSKKEGSEYYTSQVVKRYDKDKHNLRINMSRFYGIIISDGGLYPVYNIGNGIGGWQETPEQELKNYLREIGIKARGIEYAKEQTIQHEEGSGIFLVKEYADIENLLKQIPTKTKNIKPINPTRVYGDAYIVPMNHLEIINIVTAEKWEEKLFPLIYRKREIERRYDKEAMLYGAEAILDNGSYCYEILTSNYKKINQIEKSINQGKEVSIICYLWQKKIITKITKGRANLYTVDEKELIKKIRNNY